MSTSEVRELPPYRNTALSIEERVSDLLGRMTLEEKVAQTISVDLGESGMKPEEGFHLTEKAIANLKHGAGAFQKVGKNYDPSTSARFCNALQEYVRENTRLGIPILFHEECLHGHLAKDATMFPQAIAMASTWDPDLIEQVFQAIAAEVRARGGHQALSPNLDIARDPRWGRTEETYGEDTYLTTKIGVAAVHGLQGRRTPGAPLGPESVISSPKHYAGYGQVAGGRNFAPAVVGERMMLDEILPPFKAAVLEADVLGMMPSHGEIDGIPCHANVTLIDEILRKRWGFRGVIVSDYLDVYRLEFLQHITPDEPHSAIKGVEAGVDLELPYGQCYLHLVDLVRAGKISEEAIDRLVERVLRVKFLLGLFEQVTVDPDRAAAVTNCTAHKQLALRTAEKAITLLKNEGNVLPLDRSAIKRLAIIGPNADPVHLGGYSPRPHIGISPLEGIRQKVGSDIEILYAEGCTITTRDRTTTGVETELDVNGTDNAALIEAERNREKLEEARQVAERADVIIAFVGGNEFTCREAALLYDCRGDRADMNLLGDQDKLVQTLLDTGKPVIVVLINGRPLTINAIAESAPAIIEAWYLGQETGHALANALFGDINPGGRLPISFPRTVGQLPIYYSQKKAGLAKNYLFLDTKPLYPFGYGLSYTTFEYRNLKLSSEELKPGETLVASIEVTNTGSRDGDEVVQLYVKDLVASVTRPVMELKGFQRITLKAGETSVVAFTLQVEDFAFTNIEYQKVTEPGTFEIMIGPSSVIHSKARFDFVASEPFLVEDVCRLG